MKNMIKRVPLPLCGVILGLAALGNLLQSYSEVVRYACGIAAGVLMILILLKLILYPKSIREDLNNPIMASVAGTFPMALMLLSAYVKPFIGKMSAYIWISAIILHIILIIYFTIKFVVKLQMQKVFASYYIVYVGIVAASVTAPAFEQLKIGNAVFWFGFVSFVLLLILVTVRYLKYRQVPEPTRPLICIYAAPMSLCIAGYVQSVNPKSYGFLAGMFILSGILYVFALVKACTYMRLPFYPSYASFTFPFVISAIAAKQTMACMVKMGHQMPILQYVVLAETIIAVLFVVYVLIRFLRFISVEK